jgi:hypothetical protein
LGFAAGGLLIACASARTTPLTTTSATAVKARVAVDGKVDQDEIHLSKARAQQVQWDTPAGEPLQIVPDEPDAQWPLDVKCSGGHCEGTQRSGAVTGKHPYHTVVSAAAGTDPVIIIDP